ncbi:hypothetical protein GCM10025876_19310 [Demequina litorisediminis]|uniref:Catalase core domain-containing protein n=1 Tax=Demequina litorisediminis TaxID=1849022 RepID=A0ABQ6ID00_9MICO|nr:hypothetical protein GCM10025876_19310 [Demequina litorisediminis]
MSDKFTTTNSGAPVASDQHSQTVGNDGVTALTDHYLVEKAAQFNRERVPERVVHAKGGGAFGTFTTTNPEIAKYTRAALFQDGVQTEMLARFSSVAGENGSPDTWRDPRGFALKFYTTEGNYDLVGNNTPVFFIRDGIKFPDFIRSQKRLPGSHLRDNDMQWDFWTLQPESAHQVTWLMGERGLPARGARCRATARTPTSGRTPKASASGSSTTSRASRACTASRSRRRARLAGSDADHHIRDLYEHIEAGDFPKWDLHVQVMPYEDAKTYRFNPFDLTKVWPHADYPLIPVGVMEPQQEPRELLRADRAGHLRALELCPRHRRLARQDADGAHLLLRGRSPLPRGHQPRRPPRQRAPRGRCQRPLVLEGWRDALLLLLGLHAGVRAQQQGWRARRRRACR